MSELRFIAIELTIYRPGNRDIITDFAAILRTWVVLSRGIAETVNDDDPVVPLTPLKFFSSMICVDE
jgi:hypothetical protein